MVAYDVEVYSFTGSEVKFWEAVAAIQILQATGQHIGINGSSLHSYLFHLAGFLLTDSPAHHTIKFDEAYRMVSKSPADVCYQKWLATVSTLTLKDYIQPPKFPRLIPAKPDREPYVMLCPFILDDVLQPLPLNAWRAIVRYLRSYGLGVVLLGEPGQRMDGLALTEGEICSDMPLDGQLNLLAHAELVVGVPNAWTWLATAWSRSIAIYYPEGIPTMRWFGFYNSSKHGRIAYLQHQVQIPLLLAGLRRLLNLMQQHDQMNVQKTL